MTEDRAVHICRNPHGWSRAQQEEARLFICDRLDSWRNAYKNMRDFAEANGLDIVTRG